MSGNGTAVLAADIGGTHIRTAIVSSAGEIFDQMRTQVDLGDRYISDQSLIDRLTYLFSEIIEANGPVAAVGIGFPGFFLGESGVLAASPNLPNLKNVQLAESLSKALMLPVRAQNDALCAAIGEHRFGAGRGFSNLLHITLGTGIGGGLILNNLPYSGESGMAMEFGHLHVVHGDTARTCGCGGSGCVEAYASASAIAARYYGTTGIQADAGSVYKRACSGDQAAKEIIESAGSYLGMAIAEAVKLLDLHTVTISGGPTGAWPMLHPPLVEALDANLIPPLKGKISVFKSTLEDNAGLLGAAALVTAA